MTLEEALSRLTPETVLLAVGHFEETPDSSAFYSALARDFGFAKPGNSPEDPPTIIPHLTFSRKVQSCLKALMEGNYILRSVTNTSFGRRYSLTPAGREFIKEWDGNINKSGAS